MLADIDDACKQAGIMPDAFFSGHAHSIQRYSRKVSFGGKTFRIPYIVSGCGGHGGQVVAKVQNLPGANPTYDFAYKGLGLHKSDDNSQKNYHYLLRRGKRRQQTGRCHRSVPLA